MKKPYVIAHMLSSIDGRTTGQRWPDLRIGRLFETVAAKIPADAWLVGRRTMQEFCSKKKHPLGKPDRSIPKTDFVGKHTTKTYAVVIDPAGKCRWDTNSVTTEHAVEVLTEQVSTAYLRHLREKQVSYVFAGKKEVDLAVALRKLHKHFGIETVRVDGGGTMWGSFLKASLLDEISHVVVPIADGKLDTPTMFDIPEKHRAKALRLKSVKKLPGGSLWIRYRVTN